MMPSWPLSNNSVNPAYFPVDRRWSHFSVALTLNFSTAEGWNCWCDEDILWTCCQLCNFLFHPHVLSVSMRIFTVKVHTSLRVAFMAQTSQRGLSAGSSGFSLPSVFKAHWNPTLLLTTWWLMSGFLWCSTTALRSGEQLPPAGH